jgi:hypothetical protein
MPIIKTATSNSIRVKARLLIFIEVFPLYKNIASIFYTKINFFLQFILFIKQAAVMRGDNWQLN